jgi:hypothetical protein
MRIIYYIILTCVLVLSALAALPYSYAFPPSQTTLSANVSVTCPFYLKFNISPSYTQGFQAVFNYTAYPQEDCSLPSASGYFWVTNGNGSRVISNSISNISITNSIRDHSISIGNMTLPAGLYAAHMNLTDISTNSTAQSFTVLLPPKIAINRIYPNPTVNQYAIQTVYLNYTNVGNFTALNVSLNLDISGPVSSTLVYSESNALPGGLETVSITLPQNLTSKSGTYNIEAYFKYGFKGKTYYSAETSSKYTVRSPVTVPPSPSGAPISSVVPPIAPIPSLNFTSAPLYLTVPLGGSVTTSLGMLNTGNLAETLSIGIPKQFASMLSLSSTTVTLAPHQSLSDSMYLHVNSTLPASTYVIPITINITSPSGLTSTYKEFITLEAVAPVPGEPSSTTQLYLENNTRTASGTAIITAPNDTPLINATVYTIIPAYATSNMKNINAYGIPNKITKTSSGYEIQWQISYLPAGESIYGYYGISSVTSPQALMATSQSVSFYSPSVQPKLLDVLSIGVPTFYSNSMNNVTVDVLYTGSKPQDVNLSLSGPVTQRIENPNIVINATPNQVMSAIFHMKTGNFTGTLLLYLHISTSGASLNYSLPALVMPLPVSTIKPPAQPTATIYGVFKGFISYMNTNVYIVVYAAAIAAAIIALAVALKLSSGKNVSRYDEERAKGLIELREHIKRGYGSEALSNKNRIAERRGR